MAQSLTIGLLPEGFSHIRRKIIIWSLVVFATIAGFLFFIISDKVAQMWWLVPVFLCFPAYGIGRAYFKFLRRQQQEWENYRLTLDNEKIVREIPNHPTISIQRSDITSLEEMTIGAIVVKTREKDWFIYIPPEIEQRDEVLRLLALETPVMKPYQPSFMVRYRIPLSLVLIGMMIVFFVSKSPFVVIPLGLLVLGFMIYSRIQTQKNRMLSRDAGLKLWIIIVFTVMVIVKTLVSLGVITNSTQ